MSEDRLKQIETWAREHRGWVSGRQDPPILNEHADRFLQELIAEVRKLQAEKQQHQEALAKRIAEAERWDSQ